MHRPQGHRLTQTRLLGNDGPRHVLGLLPCPRGHVLWQVSAEADWISGCSTNLPAGYRGSHAGHKPDQEGLFNSSSKVDTARQLTRTAQDLASTAPTTIHLPIAALPHFITPSLALSTLSDLLPRLTSSNPSIRKKTIVTLYRLALVYPETLRAAWPKIKDRLMAPEEDPSVTAAIVNVVCELGWRRPHDFLPLAPRLFELLVEGGNNWMAIKLIKLVCLDAPVMETLTDDHYSLLL